MGIGVLGPLTVDGSEATINRRDRAVLQALAAARDEVLSPDRLADAVWGEDPPASWHKNLQGCVMRLRRLLGDDAIQTLPHGYRLGLGRDDVDAGRFERLVDRARELLTLGQADPARYALHEALGLWRGEALGDVVDWDAGRTEAERLSELRLDAEELRLECALRSGEHAQVMTQLMALVRARPLRERRWALLALAQYRSGRQAEALRTLRDVRTVLATELGLDPGPELVDLEQSILRQNPSLAVEAVLTASSPRCPYQGLVPYDVDDNDGFFGRDADVATCLRRLGDVGVVVVVGPSGSGKSSLVRAGVAAALRRDGRRIQVVTPGAHPTDALTTVHRSQVLVVDQCEEAVTLCTDPREVTAFFDALAGRDQLVVALRADRMGAVASHPGFARVVERGLHLLNPMTSQDLRACIAGPANQAGLLLEPGLVDLLLREVEDEPGALPLLSHALRETWAHREGRTLTVAGYQATGGIRAAVARTADDVWSALDPDQQRVTHDLMLRLVGTGAEGEPVRRRVPRRLLATDREHEQVVERLVAARLVTSDEGGLQIAHEALARAWPRLQDWLAEDAQGQQVRHHLSASAEAWDGLGRPDSELYRGVRLAQAVDWRDRTGPDLTPVERDFLDASRRQVDAELRAARERAEREAAARHRTRRLAAGLAAVLVLALAAAGLATTQWRVAQRERSVATAREHDASARELAAAAVSNLEVDPERSLLLAMAAIDETRSVNGTVVPEAVEALHRAVTTPRVVMSESGSGWGGRLDWSPAGVLGSPEGVFVTEGPEGTGRVNIRDAETRTRVYSFVGHDGDVTDVDLSPDGSKLATTGDDGVLNVWQLSTGELLARVRGEGIASGPSFSADGTTVAAAWSGNEPAVRVLDLASHRVVWTHRIPAAADTALNPDGTRIAVATDGEKGAVFDLQTGRREFELEAGGDGGIPGQVAWSPDGRYIATTSDAPLIYTSSGTILQVLPRPTGWPTGLAWSPRPSSSPGRDRLVTGGSEGTAKVWDVSPHGAAEALSLSAPEMHAGVKGLAFSPDGTQVMAGDFDASALKVWDISPNGNAEWANFPSSGAGVAPLFTPDGRRVLTTTPNGAALTMRDLQSGRRVLRIDPATIGNINAVDVSPDGRMIAAGGGGLDGRLSGEVAGVWDVATGHELFTVWHRYNVTGVAFSPDGDHLASVDWLGSVKITDLNGRVIWNVREDYKWAPSVRFSFDGRLIATAGTTENGIPRVRLWDWESGTIVKTINEVFVDFDPTSPRMVTALEQRAEIWDLETLTRVGLLTGPAQDIGKLAFSPDGSLVATGRDDGTIQLFHTDTGREYLALPGQACAISGLAFSPDGTKLASTSLCGDLRIWALDIDDLLQIARHRVTRPLTDQECRQYLHVKDCPDT